MDIGFLDFWVCFSYYDLVDNCVGYLDGVVINLGELCL